MNLARMMTDKFFVDDQHGVRSGPFKTKFGSGTLMVFQEDLRIAEGDRIIRPLADGSEHVYRVEGCSHSAGSRNVPPHYAIKVTEAALTPAAQAVPMANAHIVAEHQRRVSGQVHAERPSLPASIQSLAQAIEESAFPAEQKEEAKAILQNLLDHPVMADLLADTSRAG